MMKTLNSILKEDKEQVRTQEVQDCWSLTGHRHTGIQQLRMAVSGARSLHLWYGLVWSAGIQGLQMLRASKPDLF